MYKLSILGIGNMGSAVLDGVLKAKILEPEEIIIYDTNENKTKKYRDQGLSIADSDIELVQKSQVIFLALVPQILKSVGEKLSDYIKEDSLIISIAAGKSISSLREYFGEDKKYIRVMSNTPATIGEGMTAIAADQNVSQEEIDFAKAIFSSVGRVEEIEEELMEVYTGFIGSLPAYVYIFIEAIADAAVADGFSRYHIYEMIAQTIQGSARLLLASSKHPAELKDQVTSPGGTTIAGLTALEEEGFRNATIKAIRAATARAKDM